MTAKPSRPWTCSRPALARSSAAANAKNGSTCSTCVSTSEQSTRSTTPGTAICAAIDRAAIIEGWKHARCIDGRAGDDLIKRHAEHHELRHDVGEIDDPCGL